MVQALEAPRHYKIPLLPIQHEFVDASEQFVALIGGRGSGKTRAGAYKLLKLAGVEGFPIQAMVTAPTYPMLRDAAWATCLQVWPPELIVDRNLADMSIRVANGSRVLFRSTSDPEHLRGTNLGALWMDEAAQSPRAAWEILLGGLRQEPRQAFITTTPRSYNWVYQLWGTGQPGYRLITCSSRDNSLLPASYVAELQKIYATQPEMAMQEIEGKFVVVGGHAFFDPAALQRMQADRREPIERDGFLAVWKPPVIGRKYLAGVDVAEGREVASGDPDASCLQILDAQTGEQVVVGHGFIPPDELALRSFKVLERYNSPMVAIERLGPGLVVINKLIELGYRNIYHAKEHIPGWLPTSLSQNLMLLELEEAIRRGEIVLYDGATLGELMAIQRDEAGRIGTSEGSHDDRVYAVGLAWQMRKEIRRGEVGESLIQNMRPSRVHALRQPVSGEITEIVSLRRR